MTTPNTATGKRTIRVPRIQYRQFDIDPSTIETRAGEQQEGPRHYPLTFSSENPVRRFSWVDWEEYDEILSHADGDIDMSAAENGLPMFKSHDRFQHYGTVEDIRPDGRAKKLKGDAVFSSIPLGQEQEMMLQEGHIRNVSVGYKVTAMELVKKTKEGIPVYRCQWKPLEVSTEPLPGDPTVGFLDRSAAQKKMEREQVDLVEFTVEDPLKEGERVMPPEPTQKPTTPDAPEVRAGDPPADSPSSPPAGQIQVGRDRGAEAAEIIEMCNTHELGERAAEWIRQGFTPERVSKEILAVLGARSKGNTEGQGNQPPAEVLQMSKRDLKNYSMRRTIHMTAEIHEGTRHKLDGLEGEVQQELTRRQPPEHGGILLPWRIEEGRSLGVRTLGTGEPTSGGILVGTQLMPDLIDLLRNRALILIAGARLYSNLTANILFNRKTGEPTVYWMDENPPAAVTQSEMAYGYVSASPKTMMGQVQVPRQLIVQSSLDVEMDIRSDLAGGHALKLDLAALHGNGTDKQPVGIYNAADVLYHDVAGVPDLTDVTTMPALLAAQNADIGNLSWMTNPQMAGVLMRTPLVDGYPKFIYEGTFREGTIVGWTARATNQMSTTLGDGGDEVGLVFANWGDLAVCMWGSALEIVVDIYTRAAFGQILLTSYSMGDIAILRPASFVKGTGALLEAA